MVWHYIEKGHGHVPGPGSASSGESGGEGLLTGPANMMSYYNARHSAEGVKVAPLVLLTASNTMR